MKEKKEDNIHTYIDFQKQIVQNIKQLIDHDASETIPLIDELLENDHKLVFDSLTRDPPTQLKYFEAFLRMKEKTI